MKSKNTSVNSKKESSDQSKVEAAFPEKNPNPVLEILGDFTIQYHNTSSSDLMHLLGCKLGDQLPKEWHDHIQNTLTSNVQKTIEIDVKGQTFSCQLVPSDTQKSVYLYARNITELKAANRDLADNEKLLRIMVKDLQKAQQDLIDTQLQLFQSEKLKVIGRLASGVAHEVKNPLAIILQGVEFLSKKMSKEDKNVVITIDDITEAVHRADSVIKGLLDFSSLSHLEIKMENIINVLESSLRLVKFELEVKKINVVKNFQDSIDDIKIDKNKMEQVFVNLYVNAIQAMPEGGKLTISAEQRKLGDIDLGVGRRKGDPFRSDDEAVVITVADTGPGIPEENLEKIFDPFFTTKKEGEGSGLGLPIIANIIQLHKGLINIVNKEDGGAQAVIKLKV